jgi:hypothetical protein
MIALLLIAPSLFSQDTQKIKNKPPNKAVITVYYFHGQYRCMTCNNMEKWAEEVVSTKFKTELENGMIKFQPVNCDKKENEVFTRKYLLSNKHVILSKTESDKEKSWKELDKIWEMVGDKATYQVYIENEIKEFLKQKTVNPAKNN